MTLRDLGAYFVRYTEYPSARAGNPPVRGCCLEANPERAQGISLKCPACHPAYGPLAHRVLFWFYETDVPAEAMPYSRWTAVGSGIDDLSIAPGAHVEIPGHWKGLIENGSVFSADGQPLVATPEV